MLITNACDLIHFIPDTALTWIGGNQGSALGKKMSDNFGAATAMLGEVMNRTGAMGGNKNMETIGKQKANARDAFDKRRYKGVGDKDKEGAGNSTNRV
jgi:hypothetical protein